jgi:hypothetical protein
LALVCHETERVTGPSPIEGASGCRIALPQAVKSFSTTGLSEGLSMKIP